MKKIFVVAVLMIAAAACNNAGNGNKTAQADSVKTQAPPALPQSKLNKAGTDLLLAVVTRYYALKNSMVTAKEADANAAAAQLATITDSFQAFMQRDTANMAAAKPFLDTIITQSKLITTIKDETVEKQRLAFGTLSSALYGLLRNVELKNGRIYHDFCPMAFNDKGATWLSDEADIKNPYFGKKMMECGEVTDSL